jgi:type I restriction enzyme S subunit
MESTARSPWRPAKLKEVARIERDALQPEKIVGGTKYLGLEHIESGGKILDAPSVDRGDLASSKFKFTGQHLLYGKLRPYLAKIARPDFSGICSTDILPILPGAKLDRDFLCYYLRQPSMVEYANSRATGANLPRLSPTALADFEIPLPPIEEQRRIAAVLDKADELRAKRRAALAELDNLTQSIFLAMFGDPSTNPKRWPRRTLASICGSPNDIKCGPFGTQLARSEFREKGVPLWGIKNVNKFFALPTHEFIEPHTAKRLMQYSIEPGDIVMTRKGTVGNCAVYPATQPVGIMHSDLLRLRVDRNICDPTFLAHQLHNSRDVERQLSLISGGAVMPGINVTRLKNLEVLVPAITSQLEFGRRIAAVEALKSKHRTALAELDSLFASLQHRAFRGEL